jgi:hypothetical protein
MRSTPPFQILTAKYTTESNYLAKAQRGPRVRIFFGLKPKASSSLRFSLRTLRALREAPFALPFWFRLVPSVVNFFRDYIVTGPRDKEQKRDISARAAAKQHRNVLRAINFFSTK